MDGRMLLCARVDQTTRWHRAKVRQDYQRLVHCAMVNRTVLLYRRHRCLAIHVQAYRNMQTLTTRVRVCVCCARQCLALKNIYNVLYCAMHLAWSIYLEKIALSCLFHELFDTAKIDDCGCLSIVWLIWCIAM